MRLACVSVVHAACSKGTLRSYQRRGYFQQARRPGHSFAALLLDYGIEWMFLRNLCGF
jgi:hypothetical protein